MMLTLLAISSGQVRAQQLPAMEEIRAAVAAGEHSAAVQKIDKRLFASGNREVPERYELLMLKGECKLQLKDRIGAGTAFKSAVKVAPALNELAAAQANALIVDRSSSGVYKPRFGTAAEAIDILPLDSRKRAMLAYQAELSSQYKSQIDSALRADQLPPIEQIFPRVADMFFLETFATGQPAEAEQVMKALGGHAFELMSNEVARCASRVDYLTQLANSASDTSRGWDSGRLGLTSQQRDEVKAMLPYLNKIRQRASEYRRIAAKAGGDEQKWNALAADTTDVILDAESLYNDR